MKRGQLVCQLALPLIGDVGQGNRTNVKTNTIIAVLVTLIASGCASTREPVAIVLGDRIYREDLHATKSPFPPYIQWQEIAPAERLSTLIRRPIIDSYLTEAGLPTSDRELVECGRKGDEPLPEVIVGDPEGRAFFGGIAKSVIFGRDLFNTYGGRVAISSFGYVAALDAETKFYRQKAEEKVFTIFDPEFERLFWQGITNQVLDGVLTEEEAREMFAEMEEEHHLPESKAPAIH